MTRIRAVAGILPVLPIILSIVLLSITPASSLLAQNQIPGSFETGISVPAKLNYLLFVPEKSKAKKLPLIVFLHGAGERGNDIEIVKKHGPPKIVEKDKDFSFIVLSPQCELKSRWNPDLLVKLIDWIVGKYPVDQDRIYLTGLSMGGYGSWTLAAKYPGKFAAVAPICGGGNPSTAEKLKDLPIWVFHGGKDKTVPLERSEGMVKALKALGSDVKFTIYPEAGHDSWTRTYNNPELYRWFLKHKRRTPSTSMRELPTGRPDEVGLDPRKLKQIELAIEELLDKHEIAGAVTMISRQGRVIFAMAQGKMDLESGKPMKLDTIVRIYSMTKPITSVAVMMLMEEGKFQLDEPVSRYIPELSGIKVLVASRGDELELDRQEHPMTIRDLLRHTSGLTYGFYGNTAVDKAYLRAKVFDYEGDLGDMVRKLGTIPLLHQPGTRWHYGVSIDVLGYLVEVVSGQSLDVFLKRRIFEPLDMRDTGFHVPAEKIHRFATNYGPGENGGLRPIDLPASSRFSKPATLFSGGGGLVSTGRDYMRFCEMIRQGGELHGVRILRPRTVQMMTSNQLPPEAMPIALGNRKRDGVGFGLGFSVRVATSQSDPYAPVGEFGWGGAASTYFGISPQHELIVVALSQHMPNNGQLLRAVKPILYEAITNSGKSGRF